MYLFNLSMFNEIFLYNVNDNCKSSIFSYKDALKYRKEHYKTFYRKPTESQNSYLNKNEKGFNNI